MRRAGFQATITLVLATITMQPAARAWAGAFSIPGDRPTQVGICANGAPCDTTNIDCPDNSTCVALDFGDALPHPLLAELVISVDDNPPCDSDFLIACGDPVDAQCSTGTAGSGSVTVLQLSGRQPKKPKPPARGGKPFSINPVSVPTCDVPFTQYASELRGLFSFERLTESALLLLRANDLLNQPLPPDLATPLLQELKLSAGHPVITHVDGLTTTPHDGSDALPSELRATVEITILQ